MGLDDNAVPVLSPDPPSDGLQPADSTMVVITKADEHMQYSLEEDEHVETVVLEDSSR